jgi:hypothetical protein
MPAANTHIESNLSSPIQAGRQAHTCWRWHLALTNLLLNFLLVFCTKDTSTVSIMGAHGCLFGKTETRGVALAS